MEKTKEPLYKVGDKVKIVNYGHLIWENKNVNEPKLDLPTYCEDEFCRWVDISSEEVGQEGVVSFVTSTQGTPQYSIDKPNGKKSWFNEEQMELINK